MTKDRDGDPAMLCIAEASALVQAGMDELGRLLFRRKKQREKQRR